MSVGRVLAWSHQELMALGVLCLCKHKSTNSHSLHIFRELESICFNWNSTFKIASSQEKGLEFICRAHTMLQKHSTLGYVMARFLYI